MIFDRMVSFVNHLGWHQGPYLKDFKGFIQRARLFVLDANAQDVTPHQYSPEACEFNMNEFRLPFPVTAVEDRGSCMLIFDPVKDQKGLNVDRGFIDVLNPLAPLGAFREDQSPEGLQRFQAMADMPAGTYMMVAGHFFFEDFHEKEFHVRGRVDGVVMFNPDGYQDLTKQFKDHPSSKGAIKNAAASIQELIYINSGEHFILEERPLNIKQPKGKNRDRIRQSHERPLYTILKPHQIRERMGLPVVKVEDRNSPIPHERRAHVRVLRSAYFRQQGKLVSVKASWIGPSESEYKGKRYRVLLEK